jgi:hypothetical protein
MEMPYSVSTRISLMVFCFFITWYRLYLGIILSITLTLASPRSASITITFLPSLANAKAIFTERFVFPTPPLPEVTVIIRALSLGFTGESASA